MRKILYVILIVFINLSALFTIPIYSKGTSTAVVNLNVDKAQVQKGDEVKVSLNIQGQKTAAYFATVHFDETKFEWVSGPENVRVNGNEVKVLWYDVKGGSGAKQGELDTITFKAKEDGLANFVIDGEFFSEKGQLIETSYKSMQVQVGKEETNLEKQAKEEKGSSNEKNNAKLQSFRINQEGMVPEFSSDTYQYDLSVLNDVNDIEVLAIAENPNAQVEITGNTNLKDGVNTIIIKVTSEDKTQVNQYVLNVTKTSDLHLANTNLEILAIENAILNPAFDNHVTRYTTAVSNDTENLNVFTVPENEQGAVKIEGYNDLKEGENIVTVTVTAPNGITKREYIVNAYRRNAQEEEQYKKEQEQLNEKLKQAYEIEKTSNAEEENEALHSSEDINYTALIIASVAVIALIISAGIYYKKRFLKRK